MSSQTIFVTKGATNVRVDLSLVQDSSGTNPGDAITGLVFNSSGLVCWYKEGDADALTQLTLVTQTATGAHTDGGFVEYSAANAPGAYRLDLSDTIVSGTGDVATVWISGFADLAVHTVNIVLMSLDLQDPIRAGITALPNIATGLAGAIPTDTDVNGAVRVVSGTAAREISLASGLVDLTTDAVDTNSLAANAITDIWGHQVESQGTYTAQQALDICFCVLAGVTSSGGDVLESPDGVATRVTATVDGSNNRTAMSLTPSS